jgi:hypothetical protein
MMGGNFGKSVGIRTRTSPQQGRLNIESLLLIEETTIEQFLASQKFDRAAPE